METAAQAERIRGQMSTTEHTTDPWAGSVDYGSASRRNSNMDPELASIVSSLSALSTGPGAGAPQQLGGFRRASMNSNSSDVESELLFAGMSPTVRRTTLSVGGGAGGGGRLAMLGHYPASIAGTLPAGGQGGTFFERFGRTLAEATREVETGLGTYSVRQALRESAASSAQDLLARPGVAAATSDENALRKMSVSSETVESVSESMSMHNESNPSHNIWNVANAPVFRPNHGDSGGDPYSSVYGGFPYGMFGQYPSGTGLGGGGAFAAGGTVAKGEEASREEPQGDAATATNGQFAFPAGAPFLYFPVGSNGGSGAAIPAVLPPQPSRHSPSESQKGKSKGNPYLQQHPRGYKAPGMPLQNSNSKAAPQTSISGKGHHGHHYSSSKQSSTQNQHQANQQQSQYQHQSSSGATKRNGKNQQPIMRSPLLEEFRTNPTNKTYKLHEIYGSALEFCKDQHGSRFIQQELATASNIEKEVIFNEIRDHAIQLSHDVFGNYVIQKFFEFGTKTQKDILVEQFRGKLEALSLEMYACRVIQRAFEFIDEDQKIDLVMELSSSVLTMIKDQNGNHVIQKTIECIPMSKLPFILESLRGQIYHLSTHFYGCRVVQRLLEYGSKADQEEILNELDQFIPYLVQDQYGNYVIQHILQHGGDNPAENHIDKSKQDIVDTISKTVVEFSKHKFASNVVEKTILYGSASQKRQVLDKILPKDEEHAATLEDTSPLILMMRDQYANYVVQKLVGVGTGNDKKLIVIAIRSYLERLNKNNTLGNRHLASVEKLAALVEKVKL
ncbi:AAL152Wp [Eremothecium gossypii ATCC 10895]|uniref:Pumilio homology domain family member 3 n=1 Tax=Eremothecium gossypii (strain ATCC 10895 / CBS 109.51 / FGSC 9923 / NRRL Y-1056) TaxID=284811 RepID=Q75F80_EREGS|nr:AAL152Wp [Eremothecium gossypii ATCC 10895]AAS50214.1 AAL152Wp [Eremothecium gossypii ATCC 10895]AEY94499.1 FAAL152Wp [Eremothecium gossypii FDAG1]